MAKKSKLSFSLLGFLVAVVLPLKTAGSGVLPERFAEGFRRTGDVSFYHDGNLYEYIDGLAPVYLKFGFRLLEHGVYGMDGKEYSVDVYSLGSPLSAFGIFRQLNGAEGQRRDLGGEGVVEPLLAVFYKGSSYVEINPLRTGSEDEATIASLARKVETVIAGKPVIPAEVSIFPEDSLETGSQRYVDENLISSSYLGSGLTALYSEKGSKERTRLFIGLPAESAKARARFDRFRSELKDAVPLRIGDADGEFGKTSFQGLSVICLWREYVFGATGLQNPGRAKILLAALLGNLQRYDAEQKSKRRTDAHEP